MHKLIATGAAALIGVGLSLVAVAGPASAHTPELAVNCDSLSLNLTGYPDGSTVGAVLDGVNLGTTTFGGNYSSGPVALDPAVQHEWTITIDSSDGDRFDKVISGTSSLDCLPEVVVPPKPEPVVTVKTGEDGDCETGIVTRYETPFTADWTLVDNVWILGEPVAGETVISTRPATEVECPVTEPPVEEPPVEEPPVVVPPVEEPPVVVPPVEAPVTPPVVDRVVPVTDTVDALPETGGDANPVGFLAAGVLLFGGLVALIAAKTRRRPIK